MKKVYGSLLISGFILLTLMITPWDVFCQPSVSSFDSDPVQAVAIITEDDQGNPLKFPSSVFFDGTMEETYVINGGRGRIVIYGNDFFPRLSIGAGRGVLSPQGVYVDSEGQVYICQSRSAKKPPRITVLNAALFPEKEITFKDIPGAEDFVPQNLLEGVNGNIYVAGNGIKGVLVLDKDGHFLRKLCPMDRVLREKTEISEEALKKSFGGNNTPLEKPAQAADQDTKSNISEEVLGLPPELIPKRKGKRVEESQEFEIAPVSIADVACDTDGRLYLLSEETSKVYVYSPDEKFLFSFGNKGGSSGKMSRPRSLAIDPKRKYIYVVDYMRHTVLIYDMAGKYVHEIGGMGWGPGWFNYPTSITLDSRGRLIIADLFNQRVQVLKIKIKAHLPSLGPKITGPQGSFPVPKKKKEDTSAESK